MAMMCQKCLQKSDESVRAQTVSNGRVRTCNSVFACGGPYATTIGAEAIAEHNQTKAIQLLKESGYDGTPVVVLQITDRPFLNAAAVVMRQRLESVGFRVILKAMDWSTNLIVRARKTPPDKGGWNILFTWFHGADVIDPAVHFGLSGAGPNAWFGWPDGQDDSAGLPFRVTAHWSKQI